MGFHSFISFLTGYVEVLVRGAHLEKLLNLLTNSGLFLWDIRRLSPETIRIKMRAHGFLRIREFVRQTNSTVKIYHKKGWPFLRRRFMRRKMFLIGAAAFIIFLCYLSSFVFFIKVDGLEGAERRQLLAYLAKLGLKPGVSRRDTLPRKNLIEREVMIHNSQAVWLGITIHGVVAEVKVVKRKTAPNSIKVCDIIAAKDGVVSKIVAVRGMPVVKEGDTVARGDLLISGVEWLSDPEAGELIKREIPASGIVEARVWYDLEVVEPKIIWQLQSKGSCYSQFKLRWGRRLWNLGSFGKKPLGNYSWTRWRRPIHYGRNPLDIVELIKDTCQIGNWRRIIRTKREIEQAALHDMRQKLKSMAITLPFVSREQTWSEEGNFLKLTVTFETMEDISMISFFGKEHR